MGRITGNTGQLKVISRSDICNIQHNSIKYIIYIELVQVLFRFCVQSKMGKISYESFN